MIDEFDPFAPSEDEEEPAGYTLSDEEKRTLDGTKTSMRSKLESIRAQLGQVLKAGYGTPEILAKMAAQMEYLQNAIDTKSPGKSVTKYTTKYAKEYGKKLGWRLVDAERYDARTKRHHDLMLGMDVLFEGPDGLVAVQAAGKGESAAHRRRFEERGGVGKARKYGIRCLYWVFERGKRTPVKEENWTV